MGDRVELLLDQLAELPDRRAVQWAEELVRCLTDLYGAGLATVIEKAAQPDAPRGRELLVSLAEDDLVASLLVLHDLHPLGLGRRLEDVLAELRTGLAGADLRVVSLDEEACALRLRLLAPGASPALAAALEEQVRQAVVEALPELKDVQIDRLLPATPVRLGRTRLGEHTQAGIRPAWPEAETGAVPAAGAR